MTDIPQGSPMAAALDAQRTTSSPDRTATICGPIRSAASQPSTSEPGRGLFDWLFGSSAPERYADPGRYMNCCVDRER